MSDPVPRDNDHERPAAASPGQIVLEVVGVFAFVCVGTFGAGAAARLVPALRGHDGLLVAILFLFTATGLARREPDGLRRYGIDLGGLLGPSETLEGSPGPLGLFDLARALRSAIPAGLRETAVAIGVALVVFPPFIAAFYLWNGPTHPFRFALPPDPLGFALTQVLVVALPEEALFRGYVQTRLGDATASRISLLGVRIAPLAWIGASALFALVHLVSIASPARLAVFFPGLLFGWVRAWRGGIGAAILLHAMSNGLAEILARGWLLP